ncbi:reverse transcriptase domain-containing protein [Tanacetum coccineum]
MLTAPMKGEELMVYLSATDEVVSVVLLVERRGRQMLIQSKNITCNGSEVNYSLMGKLAPLNRTPLIRLRRYFQGYTIKVITDKPINQILNSREASGRLAKWVVELGAYRITYAPRNAIKGQVLADFLSDTMAGDDPMSEKTTRSKKFLEPDKAPESSRSKEEQTVAAPIDTMDNMVNSREASGSNSNNDAEYKALLAGLRIAIEMRVKKMHAFVDSKLVANQVEGSYEARGEKTKKYKGKVIEMVKCFEKFWISHIPREENKKADALSKLATVQCEGLTKGVLVEELNEQSVDMAEVNIIVEEEGRT